MKHLTPISLPALVLTALLLTAGCTSQKKLAYLNNLKEGEEFFSKDIPEYLLQPRDILYVTAKALDLDGNMKELLASNAATTNTQGESGGYLFGYDINADGEIKIPVIGTIKVGGIPLEEANIRIQAAVDKVFKNSSVECKLQSYKYNVIGEINAPGTYWNYSSHLTILEAIGRAGGIGDFGSRKDILVVRSSEKGTKTFHINLQDKAIISSEAYFILPNDVLIVQPRGQKIFNLNSPTISFMLSTVASTISTALLIIYIFKN